MKKHAYLITAYENRQQLEKLLSLLDHERNDVYLQIDSKGSLCADNLAMIRSSLFILQSFPIYWGGFSMIQAELNLLKAASERRYHYYHMITNSDLPIVSQDKIHEALENSDIEFIDFAPENYKFAHWKAAYYHVLVENKLYIKYIFVRMVSHLLVKLQSVFGIDRSKRSKEIFYHGSTYFSITHGLVEHILTQQLWIKKTFSYALACDEVFLHTLIMKSQFKSKLSGCNCDKIQNLRYIDWKRRNHNSPHTFRISDYEELKEASKRAFYARKFNMSVDREIVDLVVDRILTKGCL